MSIEIFLKCHFDNFGCKISVICLHLVLNMYIFRAKCHLWKKKKKKKKEKA